MPLMTIRQYGQLRGVTHHAVRKAIDTGKIKSAIVASESGKRKTTLIDSDVANQEWPKGDQELLKGPVAELTEDSELIESAKPKDKDAMKFLSNRAVREDYQARLVKLEFEEASGKLVDADEVRRAWVQAAAQVRAKILGVSAKIKQRIPGFPEEHRLVLEGILRETLEDIADHKQGEEE